MMQTDVLQERKVIGRLLYTFYFLNLLFRFYQQVTPSQMLQPALYRYNFDFIYWFFDIASVFQFVVQSSAGSILFDVLLFASCLLCIVYPLKHYWSLLFGVLFFTYVLCYNTYNVHHSHPLALMTLATVPFFLKNGVHWRALWDGFRYYVCYAYFISFVWKAFIGKSLLYWNMGVHSTKGNLVEYLYHFPDSILSQVYAFFIAHPVLLNAGLIFVFVLEGLMVIGFFTKRFDHLLLWIPVVVHLSTYLFSDVYFIEMLVGVFAFIGYKRYGRLAVTWPILASPSNEKYKAKLNQ